MLKNTWWPLALCGVFDAVYALIILFAQNPDGSLELRKFFARSTVLLLGKVALIAGVCTMTTAVWNSRSPRSWLLMLNGAAFSALGLIFMFWRGRLSFRTVALLLVVMAVSNGVFDLTSARTLRGRLAEDWFLRLAGIASVGFGLAFVALGFRWMTVRHPETLNIWMGSYFGFSAICMLGMARWLDTGALSIEQR